MPESPDFDAIARRLLADVVIVRDERPGVPIVQGIAEQLRQVWNARGAADIARLEIVLPNLTTVKVGAMKTLDAELRRLDR